MTSPSVEERIAQEQDFGSKVELALAATNQLFNARNSPSYVAQVLQGVNAVSTKVQRTARPFTGVGHAELKAKVGAVDLEQPLPDTAAALEELDELYLKDAVYFHDSRYAAHLNCPVVIPALVGEAVLSAVNSSMDTWDQSAGATMIERRLIDWTAERIGFTDDADGVFTSGGSQSNFQALLIARNHAVAKLRAANGDARLPLLLDRLRIFTSVDSHFSIQKSASMLGLGFDAVIAVPTTDDHRMDPTALAAALAEAHDAGLVPMAVVATAGTTDFGSVDPLSEMAALVHAYDSWLHVDGAYGGGLIVSGRHRHLLDGIHLADSVTVDFHKTFFQPVSSSAILVRNGSMMGHVTYYADYLNPESAAKAEIPNQVDKSIQTTRRFDALKLWLTLRIMGADAIGALFDEAIDLTARVGTLLADDAEFELVAAPQLSTLVFRYRPAVNGAPLDEDTADTLNPAIRAAIFASGEAVVAGTKVAGRHYLKFTLLNAEASLGDIQEIIELIRRTGNALLANTMEAAA
ncbi:L-2,4-diaminobutyrate decarboxylase [Paenarthrobacter nicotinovorans]|uniref:pyridoxal phosphate-dependent decarboxylase family protein n=1 Tax=Micrococcaceae TaxID=1268 RepID=UPI0008772073|nr:MULTISPECIES: aspartate aminotransferase family protein [Micrococcaceae]MDR6437576.1 L-2,4-diaminobutyrate decarboxylase [Paenarthrobacter nicotinovorans]SCZ60765.1 L-2,4-diaminobutyrate decarboxylase [Arthrobacter sp. UNCCL28]